MTSRPVPQWRVLVAVPLLTLVAFAPVLSNQFVDWDDGANFVDNVSYRGFGWEQLGWMATTFHQGVYQPLAWLLAALEYRIGGLAPWVFHAGSWLLHGLAATLLYLLAVQLLHRLAPDRPRLVIAAAGVTALLWAVHPLRVEAVAWASAQGYALAAVFALGSILAWLPSRDRRTATGRSWVGWYIASVTLAGCAYLAKPIAITLPAVIVLLDRYLHPAADAGPNRRAWLWLTPYVIPAVAVAAAAPLARLGLGASASAGYGLAERIGQACYGVTHYLAKTVFPVGLTVFTPLPHPFDPFEFRFVAAAVGVAVAGALIWAAAQRARGLAFITLAYLILLAPVLGLLRQGDQLVADRYAYFAGIPLSLMVGSGFLTVWKRTEPRPWGRMLPVAAVVVLGVLGVLTWNQVRVWHDPGTLWAHAVAVAPKSAELAYQAHNNLGLFYLEQQSFDQALQEFDLVVRLNPDGDKGHFNRALTLARMKRTDEAIAAYQHGLGLQPNDPTAWAHLGQLLADERRFPEAEAAYRHAVALAPHPDLFNSLGITLAEQQRLGEAIAAFREALALDPTHADARANLEMAMGLNAASAHAHQGDTSR